MLPEKKEIIARLKRDILPLEGLQTIGVGESFNPGWGPINDHFPQGSFPLGAVHEFLSDGKESAAATAGFISGILAGLMKKGGAVIWIGSSCTIFPPALRQFGIKPEQVIFIDLPREKDLLWAMEEALKCEGLAAVVGEIPDCSFTVSRRFQLAVEQSRVTGFLHRSSPRSLMTNAFVSRWKIRSLATESEDDLPGLGFPRWQVVLEKIRNGKPGSWKMEWIQDRFHYIPENIPAFIPLPKRKTG